jgi:hypothetical protein
VMGSVSSSAAALRGLRREPGVTGVLGLPEDMAGESATSAITVLGRSRTAYPSYLPQGHRRRGRSFLNDRRPDWLFVIGCHSLSRRICVVWHARVRWASTPRRCRRVAGERLWPGPFCWISPRRRTCSF